MFLHLRSPRYLVPLAATIALVSLAGDAAAQLPTYQLQLAPQDTSLNIDATNYSAQTMLTTYTWPDNQMANVILLKFDLSALPAGAVVQQAVVSLALVQSDATADATYTMAALKVIGKNPVIASATGYTFDGVSPWTPSACCYSGVPLAQADLSAPYASLAVDKAAGFKAWTITTMVREWVTSPASNFGLVLNSDATVARDRFRYFASTKNADATLKPVLVITYSAAADTTPPVISAVASSAITGSSATINWSTDEASDSQVDYGSTTAYGSTTTVNASLVTAHVLQLSALSDARVYHYRVRSRDASANVAVSGDFTFTTPDKTAPGVSISSPAAGTTVSGAVAVSALATDNVGVAGVQFKLDGVNLGAEDTTSPYGVSWSTTTAVNGTHTLTAVARDAAGNNTTSAAATVTVTNAAASSSTIWNASATPNGIVTSDKNPVELGVRFRADMNGTITGVRFYKGATNTGAHVGSLWTNAGTLLATATFTNETASGWQQVTFSSPVAITGNTTYVASYHTKVGQYAADLLYFATAGVDNAPLHALADGVGGIDGAYKYGAGAFPTQTYQSSNYWVDVVFATGGGGGDTTAPTITMTAPGGGTTVSGTALAVSATAADNVGVSGVQFKLDGVNLGAEDTVSPYTTTWNTTTASNGSHVLTAVARDAAGNTATAATVTVTVSNAIADVTPPTVSMTAPAGGATVSGTAVTVSATASDNVGVASVQFQLDGVNLGAIDVATPYAISWNTTTAAAGSHSLRAVAKDAAGNSTTSTAVTVTVSNDSTPPVISGVAASAITSVAATIGWTTNEVSDSQVDYGVTTAYGSSSSLNTSAVTSHSMPLAGLAASTTYHARVRSRDPSGNLSLSGDLAFATSATTPPPTGWPHEPAGFAPFASSSLDVFTGNGWDIVNSSGLATVVADAGGSLTPPNVGQWKYPSGFGGGTAPATMYHALPQSFNEGFVGTMWKPSNPWQGHSTFVNKIFFLLGGACGNLIPIMYGPNGGPYQLRVAPEWGNWSWLTPNVNDVPIVLGSWHKLELYFKYNTPGSGIVRWWMDGTLIGDYTNITFPSSGCLAEFQFSPTWGGVGDVKNETDYFWFDDAYISVPSTTSQTPPPPAGAVLFQENFEDANVAARGWYDNTAVQLSTTEHIPNSVSSIQYTFMQGATSPTAGSTMRKTFPPTDSVYLGYWEKHSANWVGSQQTYHPHEFHFLTNLDGIWSGLSFDYLTTYIEENGGTPLIGIQDGTNVDQTKIGVNLTAVTEHRGVAGCNGSSDGYADNCYLASGVYVNEKKWRAASPYFTDSPGAFYKADWHFVEAFVKMNSIAGGKGANDGVVQYWFDGQLIIDHHDVLLRTGANATMQFAQFVIAPYIGDGSPVTQSLWIDNLTVATGRP